MKHLDALGKKLSTWSKSSKLSSRDWEKIANNTIVVLMAGGESSRFREVEGAGAVNKNAFRLPNGDTMIEMTVRMYRDAGISKFVPLVRDKAQSVIEVLGDGKSLGVAVDYCFDPDPPAGKGGALRHAFETGKLNNNSYLIVHNPDDVILGFSDNFPRHILQSHFANEKKGAVVSAIVCEGTPHQYSAMQIRKGRVVEVEMYPFIPVPSHIGVTVFSPGLKDLFVTEFDYHQKTDFEKTLFPKLAGQNKLFAALIPFENWIPVNNLKNYKQLLGRLGI